MDPDNPDENLTPKNTGGGGLSVTGPAASPPESPGKFPGTVTDTSQESGPRFAERRTELRGQSIAPGRTPLHSRRKDTLYDLNERDPEIPYVKAERAIRDLVCALMERQDRMNEDILQRVIDLQYRMEDIKDRVPVPRKKKTGTSGRIPG